MAGLGASEARIYGRFGYGPATWDSSWRLARGAVRSQAEEGDRCSLELVAAGRPEHEPLRWALADSRQFVVTAVDDHLWLRLVDLAVALSGRRYATEGSLVLDVADDFCPWNEGRWLLEGGPDGSECRRARGQSRASLQLDSSVLGSLFLGGASVWRLAKVGRISADLMSLRCAHQMFGADLDPRCSTEF